MLGWTGLGKFGQAETVPVDYELFDFVPIEPMPLGFEVLDSVPVDSPSKSQIPPDLELIDFVPPIDLVLVERILPHSELLDYVQIDLVRIDLAQLELEPTPLGL